MQDFQVCEWMCIYITLEIKSKKIPLALTKTAQYCLLMTKEIVPGVAQ